jgi:hypothetical protein
MLNKKIPMSINYSSRETSFYFLFSIGLSLCIFFRNETLTTFMMHDGFNYYADLSKDIFHPNYILKGTYFSESMLLPLLGKLTGANATPLTYKLLCISVMLFTIPLISYLALQFFQSFKKSIIFILIFAFSFTAFWQYTIGTPDPLTILLLSSAALQRKTKPLFILVVLASLSHFAISAVAGISLTLLYASKQEERNKAKAVIFGLICGRILLQVWYLAFNYDPSGRFQWVLDHGMDFFLNNYLLNPNGFWLTPGITFLVTYGIILLIMILQKQYQLFAAGAMSLAAAYSAMFLTVDGLRIFACIICGPYVFLLSRLLRLYYPVFVERGK